MKVRTTVGHRANRWSPFGFTLGFLVWGTLLSLAFPSRLARAQASPPLRFLFVLDASEAVRPLRSTVADAVSARVRDGWDQQIRPGETFAIWTYGREWSTSRFQPVQWSPWARDVLAERVRSFVEEATYESVARSTFSFKALAEASSASERLEILVLNAGIPIEGTPFDERINASYHELQKKADGKVPLVLTTLAVRQGRVAAWSVALLGLVPAPTPAPHSPTIQAAATKPAPTVQPAWSRERELLSWTIPTQETSPSPLAALANVPQPRDQPPVQESRPAPAAPVKSAASPSAPPILPIQAAKPELLGQAKPPIVELRKLVSSSPPIPAPAPAPKLAPQPTKAAVPPHSSAPAETSRPKASEPPDSPKLVSSVNRPAAEHMESPPPAPPAVTVAAKASTPPAVAKAAYPSPTSKSAAVPTVSASVLDGVVPQPGPPRSGRLYLAVGLILLAAAVGIVGYSFRPRRSEAEQTSFISRSLDGNRRAP